MLNTQVDIPGPNGLSEYGEAFIDFLKNQELKGIRDYNRIIKACKYLENRFDGKKRKDGNNYHSHPYEVARLYIELHGEKISDTGIIVALLHDNIEDINEENYESIEKKFGKEVAILVEILSKPKTKAGETKKERNEKYFSNFSNFSTLKSFVKQKSNEIGLKTPIRGKRGKHQTNFNEGRISKTTLKRYTYLIAAIKLCDRIHNLFTMPPSLYHQEKIEEKLEETEKYFFHLALELGREHTHLLDGVRRSIIHATRLLNRKKVESITP